MQIQKPEAPRFQPRGRRGDPDTSLWFPHFAACTPNNPLMLARWQGPRGVAGPRKTRSGARQAARALRQGFLSERASDLRGTGHRARGVREPRGQFPLPAADSAPRGPPRTPPHHGLSRGGAEGPGEAAPLSGTADPPRPPTPPRQRLTAEPGQADPWRPCWPHGRNTSLPSLLGMFEIPLNSSRNIHSGMCPWHLPTALLSLGPLACRRPGRFPAHREA